MKKSDRYVYNTVYEQRPNDVYAGAVFFFFYRGLCYLFFERIGLLLRLDLTVEQGIVLLLTENAKRKSERHKLFRFVKSFSYSGLTLDSIDRIVETHVTCTVNNAIVQKYPFDSVNNFLHYLCNKLI